MKFSFPFSEGSSPNAFLLRGELLKLMARTLVDIPDELLANAKEELGEQYEAFIFACITSGRRPEGGTYWYQLLFERDLSATPAHQKIAAILGPKLEVVLKGVLVDTEVVAKQLAYELNNLHSKPENNIVVITNEHAQNGSLTVNILGKAETLYLCAVERMSVKE